MWSSLDYRVPTDRYRQEPPEPKWTFTEARTVSRVVSLLGRWADGDAALYVQLSNGIRALIDIGALSDGERLPSERELAAELGVARGTVVRAYDGLDESGRVARRRGSGTRVRAAATTGPLRAPTSARLLTRPAKAIDLRVAIPDLLPSVQDLIDKVVLRNHSADTLENHDPAGLPVLREAIAHQMTLDGITTDPNQILVTNGAQHAVTLLAMHLTQPGSNVVVEDTTWPGLTDTITHLGGRLHRVTLDDTGIDLVELRSLITRLQPHYLAFTPHHHNPTGTRLPSRQRTALARMVTEHRVPLIEDRVLARLAFDHVVPRPIASEAAAHDHPELHVTVDSLDKVAWAGLRIGWLRATPTTVRELRTIRAMTELHPAVQPQLAALAILEHLDEIVQDRITQLEERASLVLDALSAAIPGSVTSAPRGGIAIWLTLPHGTGRTFADHAAHHGVLVPCGIDFGAPDHDRHLRINFTAPTAALEVGIQRLADAWRSYRPDTPDPVSSDVPIR
jgi:DNA-binding transcriptional MocR family regulator